MIQNQDHLAISNHIGSSAREQRSITSLVLLIIKLFYKKPNFRFGILTIVMQGGERDLFDVIACRIHCIGHFQELHDPVQQAVDDLEAGGGVVENRREVSLVPGSDLGTSVAQHYVADFEEFERKGHLKRI